MSDQVFSDAEREAMRARAAELRAEGKPAKGAAKRKREAEACVEAIEKLEGSDQTIAQALHKIVTQEAPQLDAKTWYGFPAYARDGKVVVFMQPRAKFDTRYASIGFNDSALLDDGVFWPTSFAVLKIDDEVEQRLRELVRRAAG